MPQPTTAEIGPQEWSETYTAATKRQCPKSSSRDYLEYSVHPPPPRLAREIFCREGGGVSASP